MSALEELAARYVPHGLPWESFEAAGGGLEESDSYVNAMDRRFSEYFAVMTSLDIPELTFELGDAEAIEAFKLVKDAARAAAPPMLDAIKIGLGVVTLDDALRTRIDAVKRLLVVLNAVTWASYTAHYTGTARWLVQNDKMPLEEAKEDASDTYAMWSAVIELDQMGVLGPLKRTGVRGLGVAVPPAAIIAIAAVVAVAIIAWTVIALVEGSRRAKFIDDSCFDPETRRLLPPGSRPPFCDKYGDELAKNPNSHLAVLLEPLTKAVGIISTGVAAAVVVGVVLFVGARVLPQVFEAVASSRSRSARSLGGAPKGYLGAGG